MYGPRRMAFTRATFRWEVSSSKEHYLVKQVTLLNAPIDLIRILDEGLTSLPRLNS